MRSKLEVSGSFSLGTEGLARIRDPTTLRDCQRSLGQKISNEEINME